MYTAVFTWVAAQDWSGVLNTTWYSNSCMQRSSAYTLLTNVSEDCLYLNVYTPYPQPATPVPIMVFFYGNARSPAVEPLEPERGRPQPRRRPNLTLQVF